MKDFCQFVIEKNFYRKLLYHRSWTWTFYDKSNWPILNVSYFSAKFDQIHFEFL